MSAKKEAVTVNGSKYFISTMPPLQAERLLLKSIGAITKGGLDALPPEALTELLAYAGTYDQNGKEIPFADESILEAYQVPLKDIMEIQTLVVEKNFGFFADGTLNRIVERLTSTFVKAPASVDTPKP